MKKKKIQLSVTLGVIALFLYHNPTKMWVRRHPELFWIAFGVLLVTMISMACCTNVRRKSPLNFIFLGLFTFAQSFIMATAASRFNSEEVSVAGGIYFTLSTIRN